MIRKIKLREQKKRQTEKGVIIIRSKKVIVILLILILLISVDCFAKKMNEDNELVKLMIERAKAGNVTLQYRLGSMYLTGKQLKQNYSKAEKWFKKAARQGNSKAQHQLGIMYEEGYGVKKDINTSLAWYKRASQQKNIIESKFLVELNNFKQIKKQLAQETINRAQNIYDKVNSMTKDNQEGNLKNASQIMLLMASLSDLEKIVEDRSLFSDLDVNGDNILLKKGGEVISHTEKRLLGKNFSKLNFFKEIKTVEDGQTILGIELPANVVKAGYLIPNSSNKGFVIFFAKIAEIDWYYLTQIQIWQ